MLSASEAGSENNMAEVLLVFGAKCVISCSFLDSFTPSITSSSLVSRLRNWFLSSLVCKFSWS